MARRLRVSERALGDVTGGRRATAMSRLHRPPEFRNEQEAVAHRFTRQLVDHHRVDAHTYARAEQALGHRGVVDMVLLIGLYLATCALLNAFDGPAETSWP
jgi:negative regulator of replication initiation